MTDAVLRFAGELVLYGGGSAAVAYLLFQFLGKSWIENKFAQRLDDLRHQHQLEIAKLKVEIESMLSGALKIQEREFTVLPQAWSKLDDAYGVTSWATSPAQMFPDVAAMDDEQLEEFLADSELLNSQRKRVREAPAKDRGKEYQDAIFWHRLHKAKKASAELQTYVAANGIFFPLQLKQQFNEVIPVLWNAISSVETGHQAGDYKLRNEGWRALQEKGKPLYEAIEVAVQARLHAHSKREGV